MVWLTPLTGSVATGEPDLDTLASATLDVRRGVGRDVLMTFGGRIALTAAVLLGDIVLARTLGPSGKGAFALVLALSSLGAVVLGLGLDRSLAVIGARSLEIARRAFANAALWTVVMGGLGVVAVIVLYGPSTAGSGPTGPLAAVMPPLSGSQLLIAALAMPFELAYAIGLVGLLGWQRVVAFNTLRFVRRGMLTVLLLTFLIIGRLDLELVLLLNLIALGLTVGGIGWAMARAGVVGWRVSPALLREQVSFGGRTVVGSIAERIHFRADAFLLTALVSVGTTGIYSVAQGLAETIWYLPSAFGLVLFSRAVRPGTDSSVIASAMTRSMLALIVTGAVPLWLAAPTLIELVYGAPFREAGVAFQLMLPGVVAYSIVAVLSHYVIARGAPGKVAAVLIVGLAVNLTANVLLIPALGMIGAAVSVSISYSTTAGLLLLLYRQMSGRGLRETLLVKRSDVSARWAELRALFARLEQRQA
jgi:O-antigen/teichoic acid export membrane protein